MSIFLTKVIFSIGGESYSNQDWRFLESQSAADQMAQIVALWPSKYGCDGIDIDLENSAGSGTTVANNVVYFVQQLRDYNSDMIITVPVYGFHKLMLKIVW